ncbi:MAG TPA: DNA gyrase inhibitor YacG [Solibacterales bacterium]|nr:DNA gyrase inhibitor YacG [Bryobacterales bacterium]
MGPSIRCPICKKEAPLTGAYAPFCSERCKLIDLGNWASEKYVITTPAKPEDLEREDADE